MEWGLQLSGESHRCDSHSILWREFQFGSVNFIFVLAIGTTELVARDLHMDHEYKRYEVIRPGFFGAFHDPFAGTLSLTEEGKDNNNQAIHSSD